MYGYIYKTTNLISKKIYIGQKKSDKFLGNKYLGSGKKLLDAIKSYGIDNFKVELIEEIDKLEDMDTREIYWIKYYNATNKDIGYNLSEGGNVNRTLVGENNPFYNKHHTEESRKKMSKNNALYMLGKHHSEETKEKIRKSNLGKVISEEAKQRLRENAKNNPNYGMRGKHVSEETKNKLREIKKGVPSKAKGKIHITNDIEDKMIYPEEFEAYESKGWRRGRKKFSKEACENFSKAHKGLPVFNKGKIYIHKDKIRKFIAKEDLQTYLDLGWSLGMGSLK